MTTKLTDFIENHLEKTKELRKEAYLASWDFETTGSESAKNKLVEKHKELSHIFSNPEEYNFLKEIAKNENINDHDLKRQLTLLINDYEGEQIDNEVIDKMISLTAEINDKYNNHRGTVAGKKVNDTEILEILTESNDNEYRKEAWEASKEIGEVVYEDVIKVVKLRNESAKKLGYNNFYEMSLKLNEIEIDYLFETLEKLKDLSDKPFQEEKTKLDESLAKRFKLDITDLKPWHYADPFFQEAPSHDEVDLDHIFKDKDIVELSKDYYDGIGMETRDIIDRSDLYAREGKCQHAFCADIDREGDIRILCNNTNCEKWMGTMLHELGHAVYDKYLDPEQPYLLRMPAHTMSTEAIAMLFGRLSKDANWLKDVAKVSEKDVKDLLPKVKDQARLAMLVFIRWGLVMVNFERDLYSNPDQDLNTLWWDYVEKYQFIKRPENRNKADWASKIHIALAPVYYQNYILGELIASQLEIYITEKVDGKSMINNKAVGDYLINNYFNLGAKYDWNETLEKSTGEKLMPEYFIQQFI